MNIPEPASVPFDSAALLASMHGDRAAVAEMLRLCLDDDAPRLREALRAACERKDLPALQNAAHGIKGLAGELSAPVCFRTASQLEESARECQLNAALQLGAELHREFLRLCEALQRIR